MVALAPSAEPVRSCFFCAVAFGMLIVDRQAPPWQFLFISAAMVYLLALSPYLGVRRQVKLTPAILNQSEFTFDEEGLSLSRAEGEFKVRWKTVDRAVELPAYFLIYTTKIHFHTIPKRFFDGQQLPEFRAFLQRILKENGKTLKVCRKVTQAALPAAC